jgi:hypothetical protein
LLDVRIHPDGIYITPNIENREVIYVTPLEGDRDRSISLCPDDD